MLNVEFISSIHHADAEQWNPLVADNTPFLQHEFFACLEDSGSTSATTGWQPHHLVIEQDTSLIAAIPLFIKSHSYGEYMFDWAWADAYHRHRLEYFPKLLNAIPFTPATGQRWLLDDKNNHELIALISDAIVNESKRLGCSSSHCLFPTKSHADELKNLSWLKRSGYQYHWFNKNYQNFEDFLSHLSSRKRKNILKERAKVSAQNISIHIKEGCELNTEDWKIFHGFYQDTYLKLSGHNGYLPQAFFISLGKQLPEAIVMVQAQLSINENCQTVAAALFFKDDHTLYGRYWGCHHDFDSLHFELCYYQGIEYAIKHQLKTVDAGAQGEHKIQRGFEPVSTHSVHWIHHQGFRDAIAQFIEEEQKGVVAHIDAAKELLPFKKS